MDILNKTKLWLGRKSVRGAIVLFVLIFAAFLIFGSDDGSTEENVTELPPLVMLTTAAEYSGSETLSLIGNVRAFSSAEITAERSGRVTSVPVTLGQQVQAGQIIAVLENAAENAAVLQAEGAYEAALSASAQSSVGVNEAATALRNAENNAISTVRTSYSTVDGIIRGNIDTFFTNPESFTPGLRIDGQGFTLQLNQERVAYQDLLADWRMESTQLSTESDLETALSETRIYIDRTIAFVDTFIVLFSRQNSSEDFTDAELQTFSSNFAQLRSNLLANKTSVDNALASLQSARDAVLRAEISATGSQTSAADAQVKQALGALRAAQANLAETILRAPVSGTVNRLDVRTGDFINSFSSIAEVANNNALEIIAFLGDKERSLLTVGDTVMIEGTYEGRVAQIAPAVDPVTRKTEVRIAVENADIQNGDTVTIVKNIEQNETVAVLVPLAAVKFEIDNGFVFTVEENKLVANPVVLGVIRGGSVEILEGLTRNTPFVNDARGLLEGSEVSVSE